MKKLANCEFIDVSFYENVKAILEQAKSRIYRNIQNEMVEAYWLVGKMIVEKQGGKERAKYGDNLIKDSQKEIFGLCVNFTYCFQLCTQCVHN